MHKAIEHFKKADPKLAAAAAKLKLSPFRKQGDHWKSLVTAILSQQISSKAADTIIGRFIALFAPHPFPTPEDILKATPAKLRKAGISRQKMGYLKDLARHVAEKKIDFKKIEKQSDEEVITELVAVKGIGRWTAEMFLIFELRRPDVFSAGDLGLRNAIKRLYGLRKDPTPQQMEKLAKAWSPHRSLASRYLWASLDNR
jgi:DNA-3-methyladenine glycosylase II